MCTRHLSNPKARANAAVRAEITTWGLDAAQVDPGMALLRLLGQSVARVARYSRLLAAAYQDDPDGTLVGPTFSLTPDGRRVEVGEDIGKLVVLEADERDRAARFSKLALDAGIAERQVRLAEAQAEQVARVIEAALTQLGHDVRDPLVRQVVHDQLLALEA